MANIYSVKSGLASDPTVWNGGVVPVSGDRVLISPSHTVEIDSMYEWGDDSTATISINGVSTTRSIFVSGILYFSRSVSTELICFGSIGVASTGTLDVGTEVNPIPSTITAKITVNKSSVMAANKYGLFTVDGASVKMWGSIKTRYTQLSSIATAGTSSIVVTDATGWLPGDRLCIAQSDLNNVDRQSFVVIHSSYSGGNTIPLTTNLVFQHDISTYVGNMDNSVTIRSFSSLFRGLVEYLSASTNPIGNREFGYVTYDEIGSVYPIYGPQITMSPNYTSTPYPNPYRKIKSIAVNCSAATQILTPAYNVSTADTLVYEDLLITSNTTGTSSPYVGTSNHCKLLRALFLGVSPMLGGVTDTGYEDCIFISRNRNAIGGFGASTQILRGCKLGGRFNSANDAALWSIGAQYHVSDINYFNCDFGVTIPITTTARQYIYMQSLDSRVQVTATNCIFAPTIGAPIASTLRNMTLESFVSIVNKNNDVTQHEYYIKTGHHIRENTIKNRGTSSIYILPVTQNVPCVRNQSISCANGQTIRVVGYVQINSLFYNAGDCIYPTVTLSGLDETPVVFTATSDAHNGWQKYDISITNNAGYDGDFTLTYSATAKTVTTGTVYFDGVPDAPFITKVRHYGFEFDETSPTRKVNPYTVATESVAAAYTGVTINATTDRVTFGIGDADTFQKAYDYSQAWGVLNVDKDMPWNRAGALLSIADGWVVVDPSITGVTWGSGTIELNVPGQIQGSFDSCTLRFNTVGTYDLSNGLFSGTIQLVNTSPGQVIVIVLPSGIDYVNTDPMNITVQVAVQQATGSITGIVPGSRLQIYNETTATEMVNQIVAGTSYTVNYPTGTGYSAGNIIRVRLTYCNGLSAKLPVEYKTVASSGGWSFLADQKNDEVYILNGIDGSTVTEYTADYLNVQIDLSDGDGTTTIQRGYAWYCDQMTGDQGIALYFNAMYAEDTLNYVLNTDVLDIKIQNTNMSTGVVLTGGALRRKDGSSPIAPGGSIYIYYGRTYSVETGVSGLTPTESDKLLSLPDATAVSNSVWSHAFTNKLLTLAKFLSNK